MSVEQVGEPTMIDPWFLRELRLLATEGEGTDGLERTYKAVDTCAAEFDAATPYYYSAHERRSGRPPAAVGGAPGRPRVGRDPRLGPEPHRPGHRVRLLLRSRRDDRP